MKKPNLTLPATLGRMTAELFIIVAGVLLALGAQSWWEARGTAEEQRIALEALDADLALIEARMLTDSARGVALANGLRTAIDNPDAFARMNDSILRVTVKGLFWNTILGNSEYPFPALSDLESSGRLGLLPDTVRRSLSRFGQALERLYFATEDLQTYQVNQVDSRALGFFSGRDFLWDPDMGIERGERPDLAFLQDREIIAVLTGKLSILAAATSDIFDGLGPLREVRASIGRELGREVDPVGLAR